MSVAGAIVVEGVTVNPGDRWEVLPGGEYAPCGRKAGDVYRFVGVLGERWALVERERDGQREEWAQQVFGPGGAGVCRAMAAEGAPL
jgi:hypothetical protein